MGRWEPDAAGRLRAAALELYLDPGFEKTTVADIATRAGLTERTFFRYFADKREVLFAGSDQLRAGMVEALDAAPTGGPPMRAVAAALDAAAEMLGENQAFSRHRQQVINANPDLRERELIKLADLSAALADGLRRRGVPDPQAGLAAEAGMAAFRIAFERWTTGRRASSLAALMRDTLAQLSELTAG